MKIGQEIFALTQPLKTGKKTGSEMAKAAKAKSK